MFNPDNSRVTPRKPTCGYEGWRGQWEQFCRREVLGWSDGLRPDHWEFNLRSEFNLGPEWADAGGGEPGAVVPPGKCPWKVIVLFGLKLMSIKAKI